MTVLLMAGLTVPGWSALDRPWSEIAVSPMSRFTDVDGMDRYRFWASGEGGFLWESLDGGAIWNAVEIDVNGVTLNAVAADLTMNMVIAVGNGGTIVRYTPGGMTDVLTLNSGWSLSGVDISNGKILVAGRDENAHLLVLRSIDGGLSYHREAITVFAPVNVRGVKFTSVSTAVVYGAAFRGEGSGNPLLVVSEDAGATWTEKLGGSLPFVVSSVATGSLQWVALGEFEGGNPAGLFRSVDGGATWQFEQHAELEHVTDVVRVQGAELIAVGMRQIATETEPLSVVSEFYSHNGGQTWSTRDIADAPFAPYKVESKGDRVLAVGFDSRIYRRWFDAEPVATPISVLRKHVPLGAAVVHSVEARSLDEVFRNETGSPLAITHVTLHDLPGSSIDAPRVGDVVGSGESIGVTIRVSPQAEGEQWGVLSVTFADGATHDVLVSLVGHTYPKEGLTLVQPVLSFGDVVSATTVEQRFELVQNLGFEPVTVTNIGVRSGDLIAFAFGDVQELPVELLPGETLDAVVYFDPLATGVYHMVLEITTMDGTLLLPITATVRGDVLNQVVSIGNTEIGQRVEREIPFRHSTWNTILEVHTVHGPQEPFAVTSTTPLPFEGEPMQEFVATVALEPHTAGRFASVVSVPWSFGPGYTMREERRIVVGTSTGITSVHEDTLPGQIRMTPQPASEVVRIELTPGASWRSVSIMDLQGREVRRRLVSSGELSVSFDVHGLPSGLYQVIAQTEAGYTSRPYIQQ